MRKVYMIIHKSTGQSSNADYSRPAWAGGQKMYIRRGMAFNFLRDVQKLMDKRKKILAAGKPDRFLEERIKQAEEWLKNAVLAEFNLVEAKRTPSEEVI